MGLFQKNESYVGVDIGAHGIKLVELKKNKGRPQLWTYGIAEEPIDIHPESTQAADGPAPAALVAAAKGEKGESVPTVADNDPRIDKYANILKKLVKESKVTAEHATASLPVSYVFHAVLTLPQVEKKDLDSIVQAQIQKLLPRPIEEMQVVYQQVPNMVKDKYIRLLVTAAPKKLVAFYTSIFQKAGFNVGAGKFALETEAFALERSLVGRDTSTVMVLDVGAERTNFFIIDQGLPMTHRSIQLGGNSINAVLGQTLGVDPSLVNQVKRDMMRISPKDIDTGLFDSLFDPVIKEIQYSFNLFLHQSGNEGKQPEKIILTGGSAMFPLIAHKLSQAFNMRVFVGDPWARVVYQQSLRPVLDTMGPRMSVAIGLALRSMV